MNISSTAP